jgi:hypothetical protein
MNAKWETAVDKLLDKLIDSIDKADSYDDLVMALKISKILRNVVHAEAMEANAFDWAEPEDEDAE